MAARLSQNRRESCHKAFRLIQIEPCDSEPEDRQSYAGVLSGVFANSADVDRRGNGVRYMFNKATRSLELALRDRASSFIL